MGIALRTAITLLAFMLGYFWPRSHYEFNPQNNELCAVQWTRDKACVTLHYKGWQWIPLLEGGR